MVRAIYPGSFDPVTNGHLDIIERASSLVDELIVSVLENPNKKSLFTVEERKEHLKIVTGHIKNVRIESFKGLLVDFARQQDARIVFRGLRAVTDFESEFQMALINKSLRPEIETLFISTNAKHLYLSSSAVKEVAVFGGDIKDMVPGVIEEFVLKKFREEGY